jgi:L-fuconolactonase
MRIDAHHHFWNYSADEYGWISDAMHRLRRNYSPADLSAVLQACGVDGVISVQARQSLEETRWLAALASEHSFIRGVVGWVPLEQDDVGDVLDSFSGSALRGVRHVVQDEDAHEFLARPHFNRGLRALAPRGLVYDLLIHAGQLPAAAALVDRHPGQTFVLDHAAKPVVDGLPDPLWCRQISELARRPQVYCKFSGLVTEAPHWRWSPATIQPYFDQLLAAFGPSRLLFGSDWPVCLVAAEYADWLACVESLIAPLSAPEKAAILGQNAITAYRLPANEA